MLRKNPDDLCKTVINVNTLLLSGIQSDQKCSVTIMHPKQIFDDIPEDKKTQLTTLELKLHLIDFEKKRFTGVANIAHAIDEGECEIEGTFTFLTPTNDTAQLLFGGVKGNLTMLDTKLIEKEESVAA